MVEIHGDDIVLDFTYRALDDCPDVAEHRNHIADHEQFLAHHAFHCECALRKVKDHVRVDGPVAFFRVQGEFESIARFLAFEILLEFRKKHAGALDVVQRTFLCGLVCEFSFHNELVGELDNLVLIYFHKICIILCSRLKRVRR